MRKNVSPSARLLHVTSLMDHMWFLWPLIALSTTALRSETIDPSDCARSNPAVGAGKEQGQVR